MLGRRTPPAMTPRTSAAVIDADTSDGELVAAIGRQDQRALAEAFRRHSPSVAGLARRVLDDEALAQDVVQDVFVRLWEEPGRFDSTRGSLRTLLLTQAHGRSVDIIRTREARKKREDRMAREPATPQPEVDAAFLAIAQAEAVREAMISLSEGERRILQLTYFEGHTYRGAAAILGLPEGTVKGRIRAALRKLHEILIAQDDLQSVVDLPNPTTRTSKGDVR